MDGQSRLRVALLGEGERAQRWACALRERVALRPLPEQLPGEIDALVLAPGASDAFARAKEALLARVPVLYAAPFLLSPWQAGFLDGLSRRQRCLLRFVEPFQYRRGFAFLRRVLDGKEPLWRPLYVRTLCLAQPDRQTRIDELATEELAICDTLLGGRARSVTAAASRRDDAGDVCAVFLVLHTNEGPLAQCTISLAEATAARQLVAVTSHRTVIMDDLDPVTSVRIVGDGEHELFVGDQMAAPSSRHGRERMLASASGDIAGREVKRFLDDLTAGGTASANSDRWVRVAALWWAARQSMSFGEPIEIPIEFGEAEPPPLRVIQGGGKTVRTDRQRPALTVVAR